MASVSVAQIWADTGRESGNGAAVPAMRCWALQLLLARLAAAATPLPPCTSPAIQILKYDKYDTSGQDLFNA